MKKGKVNFVILFQKVARTLLDKFYIFANSTDTRSERERERGERQTLDRQKERDVAREDGREGRRERERRPREGERDGGGAMETHNTYTDT